MKRNRATRILTFRHIKPASAAAWLGLLALLAAGTTQAAERALTDIQYKALPGQQVRIQLTLSGPAPEPKTFAVSHPARLSMDLPDTALAVDSAGTRLTWATFVPSPSPRAIIARA